MNNQIIIISAARKISFSPTSPPSYGRKQSELELTPNRLITFDLQYGLVEYDARFVSQNYNFSSLGKLILALEKITSFKESSNFRKLQIDYQPLEPLQELIYLLRPVYFNSMKVSCGAIIANKIQQDLLTFLPFARQEIDFDLYQMYHWLICATEYAKEEGIFSVRTK